ncbi:MAG: hypothetical protein V1844_01105 [Pseudomonadota bacterium]
MSEFISDITKSFLPSLFVGSILFIVLFAVGLPKTIFKESGLLQLGQLAIALIISHQGTTISIAELKKQLKTVAIVLCAEAGIIAFVFFIGQHIWGLPIAAGATAPMGGGIVSAIIITEIANSKNLITVSNISVLVLILSMVVGYPICAYSLKTFIDKNPTMDFSEIEINSSSNKLINLPEYLKKPYLVITRLSVIVFISFFIDYITSSLINKYVLCLLLSITCTELGFLESKSLDRTNSKDFLMIILLSMVYFQVTYLTVENLLKNLATALPIVAFGLIGILIFTFLASIVFKMDFFLSFSLGCSALFGFPGTQIITEEAIKNSKLSEANRQIAMQYILPKMIIGGFVSVTIISVILATIFSRFL